jgi:uncharacterized protein YbaR (Trm112 family)
MLTKHPLKQISYFERGNLFYQEETEFMVCNRCEESYPILNGKIMCNGQEIQDCPCGGK